MNEFERLQSSGSDALKSLGSAERRRSRMASSDVGMQEMSEVVIVTLPEAVDLPSVVEEDKAVLVTAELAAQAGEDVLAVAPVETEAGDAASLSKEETVIVKLSEEVDVEADVFYPVTCGDAKATLVWKKFVCPGINVKCVQFNEHLISPKEFVCLAGKSTLKDWKRAIRLNGTMLRKIMDSGELDFYQHSRVCSNTCRSTKIDLVGTKVSLGGDQSDVVSAASSSADLNGASLSEVMEEPSEWVTAIGEDSVTFWRAVKEAGLLEEVVEDFQKELQEVLKGLQERVHDPPLQVKDAVLLNNIVQNFGMLDLVKKVLASHKNQMDHYREQYTRSLAALEQQCDEHRRRAKELKSKSQHLNNLSGLPLGKVLTVAGGQPGGGYTLLTSPLPGSELVSDASNVTLLSAGQDAAASSAAFVKMLGPQFQLVTLPFAASQGAAVQHQVTGIVVDAVETESQEESAADGEEEGQPEQGGEE
ncbi:hypothetical protein OJAV_G00072570 [Oryzias javanicus]|uniref:SAND domain-containing protein n=1 Tax=Oryzias javanicus TaxID=123683 RepID=A0A3S2PN66_ORYJA|nr:hypothetical protein OJAV_G00072570 [Oryzias javanicus]